MPQKAGGRCLPVKRINSEGKPQIKYLSPQCKNLQSCQGLDWDSDQSTNPCNPDWRHLYTFVANAGARCSQDDAPRMMLLAYASYCQPSSKAQDGLLLYCTYILHDAVRHARDFWQNFPGQMRWYWYVGHTAVGLIASGTEVLDREHATLRHPASDATLSGPIGTGNELPFH
ncbi:hypothetical protein K504DRAFT_3111 [Pleomassaria siparia CBS 279.74]|uniref:Uncharacterized protein n=1 Tax=Pleomassaria siparia CBS 279.74 TaxID=1314801 RepID=A0A6G1KQ26_9PLEO|nr:hypothetical protein K504DRAFT_3111 [Pleomassaria siparia CBS 279.74]